MEMDFMGKESMMGEGPESVAGPMEGEGAKAAANYKNPEERCVNCAHFDGAGMCNKYQFEADPDGTCDSFEEGGAEEAQPEADGMEVGDVE